MSQQQLELPKGWSETSVNDIIKIIDYRGRTPPYTDEGIPHLRSANIKDGKIIWKNLRYVTKETYEKYMTRGLPQKGDILFTSEAPLGEATLVPDQQFCLAQRLMILHPLGGINSKFLLYQFSSPDFQGRLTGRGTGTTVTGVSSRNFKPMKIVLCSLNEQEKIASKIEELFSKIDSTKQSLEHTKLQLKQYRYSLLKSAFDGKLTAKWREQHKNDFPDNEKIEGLPVGWTETNIGSVAKIVHYGFTATSTKKDTGTKYLRITDIQNDHVDWNDVPFCKIPKEKKPDFLLNENDIVFARTGGTVGKSYLIKNDVPSAVFASYLIRIILSEHINPKLIYLFFQSASYWHQIQKGKLGLQTNVNAQILSKLIFQLPLLRKEQDEIVSQIEQGFSLIENSQRIVNSTLQTLETMRMSVLKQAFEGKLVPQDPNDEPAEILLERIKKQKS